MLRFNNQWRFDSPGPIEPGVVGDFLDLINRISGQGSRKAILEHFKSAFAAAAGMPYHSSSDASWAASDLERTMDEAAGGIRHSREARRQDRHLLGRGSR